MDQLYDSIIAYFKLSEMVQQEQAKRCNEPKPNTPPIFRIRGLVSRDVTDGDLTNYLLKDKKEQDDE